MIELARKKGIEVIERDVTRSELYICDEVFFSGTGVQVAWVKEIDKRVIGNGKMGPITKQIQDLFFEIVTANNEEYAGWLSSVY